MDDQDDPYDLLNVSRDATASQIKVAYRKAALKYHPDRLSKDATGDDIATANLLFSKISNAYELLSDETKRAAFDRGEVQPGQQPQQRYTAGFHNNPNFPETRFPGGEFPFHFHDPFELFRHVFGEEFQGRYPNSRRQHHHQRHHYQHPDPFRMMNDPFGGMMNDPFMNDPFFSASSRRNAPNSFFGGGPSLFGGGPSLFGSGFGDMFEQMERQMMQQQQQQQQPDNGSYTTSYYSSSSSTRGRGGEAVTTQTTRRIINGQEQVVTERIIQKPDGSIERHVLRNDGAQQQQQLDQQQPPPALDSHHNNNNTNEVQQPQQQQSLTRTRDHSIDEQEQQQPQPSRNSTNVRSSTGFLPWRRKSSKRPSPHEEEQASPRSRRA